MNARIIIQILCFLSLTSDMFAEDEAALKQRLETEKQIATVTASANFVAACINVTREVQERKIKIYAVSSSAKRGAFKLARYRIQVIYNEDLEEADSKAAGAYYQHNNCLVLAFAAWQFSTGNKTLGLQLVRMIAAAHPSLGWSSTQQPPTSIQKILAGLEKNDESVRLFLDEEKQN